MVSGNRIHNRFCVIVCYFVLQGICMQFDWCYQVSTLWNPSKEQNTTKYLLHPKHTNEINSSLEAVRIWQVTGNIVFVYTV